MKLKKILALAMVLVTLTGLLPAQALATDEVSYLCGLEAHTHGESCTQRTCTLEEGEAHAHGDTCYGEKPLICEIPEAPGHAHTDACKRSLVCAAAEGHVHSVEAGCFALVEQMVCTSDQEGHVHEETCVTQVPGETVICAAPENHVHSEDCYAIGEEILCGQAETQGHTHTDTCYGEAPLVCQLAETQGHAHGDSCDSQVCTLEEHTHTESCLPAPDSEETDPDETDEEKDLPQGEGETDEGNSGIPAVNFTNAAPLSADGDTGSTTTAPVVLDKNVTDNGDGTYTLTLESYATGKTITTQNYSDKPADIVLVLDYSDSMTYCSDPNCKSIIPHSTGTEDLLYNAKYNGTSDEIFVIHSYRWTEDYQSIETIQQSMGTITEYYAKYKVQTLDEGPTVFRKVYYCSECSQSALDKNEENADRGRWHWKENLTDHKSPIVPFQSNTGGSIGTLTYRPFYPLSVKEYTCVSRYQMLYEALQAFMADIVKSAKGSDGIGSTTDDVDHKVSIVRFSTTASLSCGITSVLDADGELSDTISDAMNIYKFNAGTSTDAGLELGVNQLKTLTIDNTRSRLLVLLTDGVPTAKTVSGVSSVSNRVNDALKHTYDAINTYRASVYTIGIFSGADASDKTTIAEYNVNHFKSDLSTSEQISAVNSFMKLLSSNYPNISKLSEWEKRDSTALTINPALAQDQSYYLSANDTESLKEVFEKIAGGIGSETVASALDATTLVKDVVTPYFDVVPGSQIKAYTLDYTGNDAATGEKQWGTEQGSVTTMTVPDNATKSGDLNITMTVNADNTTTVDVTGFDFGTNYVGMDEHKENGVVTSTTPHGKKLVIEIIIKPDSQFLGGNNVPTNAPGSGIYTPNGEGGYDPVEEFEVPKADVVTDVKATILSDVNIYLGSEFKKETGTDGQLYSGLGAEDLKAVIKVGYGTNTVLDLSKPNYGLDSTMSEFIEVHVDLYQATNPKLNESLDNFNFEPTPVVAMKEILWDTPYKLIVTITPKDADGACKPATATAIGWVHVFYPQLTFQDTSEFYYGETITATELQQKGLAEIDWVNASIKANKGETGYTYDGDVDMVPAADGKTPEVTMICTPDGGYTMSNKETPVNVEIKKIGNVVEGTPVPNNDPVDFNAYSLFRWKDCAVCDNVIAEHAGHLDSPEFYIHPQTCELTITKSGGDAGEPYVFTILKDGKAYTQASITGNNSVTIYKLPVGTYSIQEDTDWSWRYTGNNGSPAVLSRTSPTGSITCTNSDPTPYWLNGYSTVVPNIFGIAH